MTFEQHAFISYAHIDNDPLDGQKGWVAQFHATLQTLLSQRLGEKACIWRDDKLDGNDVFDAEIVGQFEKTALLVAILSPRYVRSDWCTRELREFCAAAARAGGITFGNKSRIFKVIKTPIERSAELPDPVQRTLGYEFFSIEDGEPRELDPAFGDQARQQFLGKLSTLAWDLARSLQQLNQTVSEPSTASPVRATVFVADCGRDLRDARENLATELRMHGHQVLPAQLLPLTEGDIVTEVTAQLERCALAIHLVGSSAGTVPDGPSGRSLMMIENDLAAARSRQGALRRLIWIPAGAAGERAEQQAFIEALQRDAALQFGADLLRGDIESFKGAMHLALHQLEKPPAAPATHPSGEQKVVHILMSEADRVASVALIKLLRAQGLAVTIPAFAGDAGTLRDHNAQLLSASDAVVLYYGAGDETWKFHQQNDLRKKAGQDSPAKRRTQWLCLAAPLTDDKQVLQALAEPGLIDALGGFSDAALGPLLSAIKAGAPGP